MALVNEEVTALVGRMLSAFFAVVFWACCMSNWKLFFYAFVHAWLFLFFHSMLQQLRERKNIADGYMVTLFTLVLKLWALPSLLHYMEVSTWGVTECIFALEDFSTLLLIIALVADLVSYVK